MAQVHVLFLLFVSFFFFRAQPMQRLLIDACAGVIGGVTDCATATNAVTDCARCVAAVCGNEKRLSRKCQRGTALG
jgi:hypothetical protein